MEDHVQVQSMLSPAIEIDAGVTIADTLQALEHAGAEFVVVCSAPRTWVAVFNIDHLRTAYDAYPASRLESLVKHVPLLVIEPDMALANVVQIFSKALVLNPEIEGLIIDEEGTMRGVLSWEILRRQAAEMTARGGVARLPGDPVGDIPIYECPIDHTRRLVSFFDPLNPPKCPAGHEMKLVDA